MASSLPVTVTDCSIELNINRLENHDITVGKTKGIKKKKIHTPVAMLDPQNSIGCPVIIKRQKKTNRPALPLTAATASNATHYSSCTVVKDVCVPEILRNKVQQTVKEALLRSGEMQLTQFVNSITMISSDIEGLIFEQYLSTYREKCRDILYNLKDPDNGALRDAVCKGINH